LGGQATLHQPELGRLVTSNCQEVWEMSGNDLRKKSQNALDHREPVLAQGSAVTFSQMASSSSKHHLQGGERSISMAPLAPSPAPRWDPAERLKSIDCLGHGGAKLRAHLVAVGVECPFSPGSFIPAM